MNKKPFWIGLFVVGAVLSATAEIKPPFRTADLMVRAHRLRRAGGERNLAEAAAIDEAVRKYAVVNAPGFYTVYARSVDADGTPCLGDDGMLPNLMSLPYYCGMLRNDSTYINTRRLALNDANPWMTRTADGDGLARPGEKTVSPEALVMRALTSANDAEIRRCLKQYRATGTGTELSEKLHAELVARLEAAGRRDLLDAVSRERTERERRAVAAEAVAKAAALPHPRLFADKADFARLKRDAESDPRLAAAVARVLSDAEDYLSVKPVAPQKVGHRILGECRKALTRLATLGMAWQLTGDRRFVARAGRELDGIASFPDWNPGHFLDVAEMTLAVALCYDWMFEGLSPEKRRQAEDLLVTKGLGAGTPDAFWTTLQNNWVQVCNAGMLSAAIALADREPATARAFVAGMLKSLPEAMCVVAPDGCFPEGPMYWSYGFSFNVFAFALCEKAFGSTLGLADEPGVRETAEFPELMTGPSGLYFNFSDSGDVRHQLPALWWFARHLKRPDLVSGIEGRLFDAACARRGIGGEKDEKTNRAFPISLLWYQKVPERLECCVPDTWVARGAMPIAVQCSDRANPNAVYVGLKGGSPSFNHGHMDGGSFVLDMLGERWVVDPGRENYSKIEERLGGRFWAPENDSPRWKVFRTGGKGHAILSIGGDWQDTSGEAKIVRVAKAPVSEVELDLSTLYPRAKSVRRTSTLGADGRSWTLTDELDGLTPGTEVTWGFCTRAAVEKTADGLTLTQNGKKIRLTLDAGVKGVWSVEAARGEPYETPNPGLVRVTFACRAPAACLTLVARFAATGGQERKKRMILL